MPDAHAVRFNYSMSYDAVINIVSQQDPPVDRQIRLKTLLLPLCWWAKKHTFPYRENKGHYILQLSTKLANLMPNFELLANHILMLFNCIHNLCLSQTVQIYQKLSY